MSPESGNRFRDRDKRETRSYSAGSESERLRRALSRDDRAMNIQIYAINLDRSVDRWNALSRRAEEFQLPIVRVSGVDGTQTPPEQRVDCDIAAFEFKNGRTMLPGEYGCYRSHLKALTQFLASGDDLAVIVEDDIVLPVDLLDRVRAAVAAVPDADVIKF